MAICCTPSTANGRRGGRSLSIPLDDDDDDDDRVEMAVVVGAEGANLRGNQS
jgi:hypothetical protein